LYAADTALAASIATKANGSHTQTASTISDSTTAGRALLTAEDVTAQKTALGLGTAAALDVGTTANKIVQLTAEAKLPAVDGSLLTGIVGRISSATVAGLAALTPTNGSVVDLLGYYAAGDGGGQQLIYRSSGRESITLDGGFYLTGSGASDYFEAVDKTVISAKRFGCRADGTTNDAVALQNMISVSRSTFDTGLMTPTRKIVLETGSYATDAPINIYSGVWLTGSGPGSKIIKGSSFSGASLLILKGDQQNYVQFVNFDNLGFDGDCVAVTNSALASLAQLHFYNLFFSTTDCFVLDSYIQSSSFNNIFSYGDVNRILHCEGNNNEVNRLVKEGGSGSSAEPYVKISQHAASSSGGWLFKSILLEGAGSVNKTPFVLDSVVNTQIENYWCEVSASNGYRLHLKNCTNIFFNDSQTMSVSSTVQIKLENSHDIHFDELSTDGSGDRFEDHFELVGENTIYIDRVYSRNGTDSYRIGSPFRIGYVHARSVDTIPFPYVSSSTETHISAGNLLYNPSFDAGIYNWEISVGGAGSLTTSVIPAETNLEGKALRCEMTAANLLYLYQNLVFSTDQCGKPYTFSCMIRMNAGTANMVGSVVINGCGVEVVSQRPFSVTEVGEWHFMTLTITPQTAGTMLVGIQGVNFTSMDVDECNFSAGVIAKPNPHHAKEIQVDGRIITRAAAKPTTGTWRVSDWVLNTAPGSTSPLGWICTVAGTPGTWQATGTFDVATWNELDSFVTGYPVASQYDSTHNAAIFSASNQAGIKFQGGTSDKTTLFQFSNVFYVQSDQIVFRDDTDSTSWLQYSRGNFIKIGRADGYPLELVGGLVKPNLPTSNPGAGYLWNDGGTVKVGT